MQQANSTNNEEEIDLSHYWGVISRRKWSILVLSALTTLLAALVVYSMTPYYKATATLLIEPQQSKLQSIEDLFGMNGSTYEYYYTQLELVKSRKLAEKVVRQLNLVEEPEFVGLKESVKDSLKDPLGPIKKFKQWLSLVDEHKEAPPSEDRTFDMVVTALQSRLTAELVKDTQLITLTFVSESPKLAADMANALANAYIDDRLSSRVEMTEDATQWMEQRLKVLRKNLQDAEKALQSYKEQEGLVDVKGVSTLTAQELDELTSQLVRAKAKYSDLSKTYGPKHPKLIAAREEVRAAQRELVKSKGKLQDIGRKEVRLRELQRQVESSRQLYDTFLTRQKETSQSVNLKDPNARISDLAIAPLAPFKPKKKLIVMLAFFTSLMLGILLAFLNEALDKTFRNLSDVENKLRQPILGLLPLFKADKKTRQEQVFVVLDEKEPTYAEAMRTIRTGLVLSSLDNPHKVILVTSSIPGEGKSTASTNLAAMMGKLEKVLLIGADLRRPTLAKELGFKGGQLGLTNIVAGTSEISECIHRVERAGFDFLPCGQVPPNPLELLSSERFASMLATLEKEYDRIVIDSPPVQAVSDALVLSRYAKAVVYIVAADSTHEDVAKNGIKRLLQYDAPLAGIVLNKFDTEKSAKYGYDYSGYFDHYGYQGGDGK